MNQETLPRRLLKVDTLLCCMSIWEDDQKTLVGQERCPTQDQDGYTARPSGIS